MSIEWEAPAVVLDLRPHGEGGAVVVQAAPGFVSLGTVNARPPRERLELKLDLGEGVVLHLVRG